jgi:2TM domain
MPPRWPRKPDRQDPAFRRLDDRMNFAVHVAAFGAVNSSLWFVEFIQKQAPVWAIAVTGGWATALFLHGLYVFALAKYSSQS